MDKWAINKVHLLGQMSELTNSWLKCSKWKHLQRAESVVPGFDADLIQTEYFYKLVKKLFLLVLIFNTLLVNN